LDHTDKTHRLLGDERSEDWRNILSIYAMTAHAAMARHCVHFAVFLFCLVCTLTITFFCLSSSEFIYFLTYDKAVRF